MSTAGPDPAPLPPRRRREPVPTVPRHRSVVLHPAMYAFAVVAVFAAVVLGSMTLGWWSTSAGQGHRAGDGEGGGAGRSRSEAVVERGEEGGAGAASGIKGRTTVGELAEVFGASRADLAERFGIATDVPADTPLRDVAATTPGFSMSELRAVLSGS